MGPVRAPCSPGARGLPRGPQTQEHEPPGLTGASLKPTSSLFSPHTPHSHTDLPHASSLKTSLLLSGLTQALTGLALVFHLLRPDSEPPGAPGDGACTHS